LEFKGDGVMKKTFSFVGVIIVMASLLYLESPVSFINEKHVQISSTPYEVLLADATTEEGETVSADLEAVEDGVPRDFVLEMVFEEVSEIDGYVVETYREYEIYKNEQGQVVNKVPTSNYDYIRYYK
jgi:hypothetical protein